MAASKFGRPAKEQIKPENTSNKSDLAESIAHQLSIHGMLATRESKGDAIDPITVIRLTLAQRDTQGWIFVETGILPKSREWVSLCVEHDGKRHVAPGFGILLFDEHWKWECEFKVIAWQPLPAPPSEANVPKNGVANDN